MIRGMLESEGRVMCISIFGEKDKVRGYDDEREECK